MATKRNVSRCELRKLRELVWHLIEGKTCPFCGNGIAPNWEIPYGHGDAPELPVELAIHHLDEDSTNNLPENRALCHRACHKAHHMSAQRRSGVTV